MTQFLLSLAVGFLGFYLGVTSERARQKRAKRE